MQRLKIEHIKNFLHVRDLHKIQFPRIKLCGEYPTSRGLYVELKYFDLLVLAAVFKSRVPRQEITEELRRIIPEVTV